jgi:hypothetical protein
VTSATVCLSPNWVERMEVYKPLRKLTFELFGRPKRHGQALKA